MSRIAVRSSAVLCLVLALLFAGYLFYVAGEIQQQSNVDESQPADVILVLGAAEYHGRPSPVLQSRLDHALLLYFHHDAPYLLTTGGSGGDPDFTESEVGRNYLISHGVRSEAIITEKGSTTGQSVAAAVETMHRMNLHSCIVVSDGYHIYRVKRIMQSKQIKVYGSPRLQLIASTTEKRRWLYLRQAIGFVLWQVGVNI